MTIKTIFLDRDGVINQEGNYLYKVDDFKFIDSVFNTCKYLTALGYKLIIISNQSGISRGFYTHDDYMKLTNWMIQQFNKNKVSILDVFHCPHSPDANCTCRKPKPGMLFEAEKKHNINMKKSWMIGDKETDIVAANQAGIFNTILVRSGHKIDEENSNAKFILDSIHTSEKIITS
jgi:D-glycero-D-manno-heptose 1,7-bisphosphate phosphatase